jgi:hypothetical protein
MKFQKEYAGAKWIELDDLKNTKLRLRLELAGSTQLLPEVELSLDKIFTGAPMDAEVERLWKKAIEDWSASQGFWDRYVTHRSLSGVHVQSALVRGENVLDLGEFAKGKAVRGLLGMTWLQRLKSFFSTQVLGKTEEEARKKLRTRNSVVLERGQCSSWYKRILGIQIMTP